MLFRKADRIYSRDRGGFKRGLMQSSCKVWERPEGQFVRGRSRDKERVCFSVQCGGQECS